MSDAGRISLVPEYGSSDSDSESESKGKALSTSSNINIARQPQSDLGAKLSSILPPPRNVTAASNTPDSTLHKRHVADACGTTESKKVKIFVNVPQVTADQPNQTVSDQDNLLSKGINGNVGSDKALQMSSGSVFSDLSRILPAPKNSRSMLGRPSVKPSNGGSTMDKGKESGLAQPPVLVPHSLTKRQKAKPTDIKGKGVSRDDDVDVVRSPPADNKLQASAIDDDCTHLDPEVSGPFFTINESEKNTLPEDHQYDEDAIPTDDSAKDNVGTSTEDPQAGGVEMYYDPNSGYYYDYASGLYYYYDQDRGCYIDARDIYRGQNDSQHMTGSEAGIYKGDNLLQESKIDKADMERLIGRGALKRGEADAIFGAAVKDLSHQSQLVGSGYSDAKSGTDFAAKRAAERRRRETHKTIESDQVDKKKKQKHNIMYLALQAQEQESELKEAHANRKNARKAARSKYGL